MWDLIVSVSDQCLSFYFKSTEMFTYYYVVHVTGHVQMTPTILYITR